MRRASTTRARSSGYYAPISAAQPTASSTAAAPTPLSTIPWRTAWHLCAGHQRPRARSSGTTPTAATAQHGFLYSGGTYITLDDPVGGHRLSQRGSRHVAFGINASGQIVGTYVNGSSTSAAYHGFVYSGGTYTTRRRSLNQPTIPHAQGINASGQIVGTYIGNASSIQRAFSTTPTAAPSRPLAIPGDGATPMHTASTTSGQIVGSTRTAAASMASLYSGGTLTPSSTTSAAYARHLRLWASMLRTRSSDIISTAMANIMASSLA